MPIKSIKPKSACPTCGKCFVNVALHITKAHDDYKAEVSYHPCGEPKACVLYKNGVVIERFLQFGSLGPCPGFPNDISWGQGGGPLAARDALFWVYNEDKKQISFHYPAGGPKAGVEYHPGKVAFKNYTLIKK